ncbi:MAG: preprotein translocase subunit SecE [Clostridia bacterium]|jgi:preprotein translocase subunit SecE|nr:preprotein translocase subunit SecE [Clostridia bacterium]
MKKKIFALLVAFVLVLSVFAISAFAADEDADEPVTITALGAENTEAVSDTSDSKSTETATEPTTEVPTTGETTTPATEKTWIEKNLGLVISLGVIVVAVIVVLIILAVSPKFREKFKKFWRDYNAEFKKLVWPTKQQLVRNSAVVLVTIIIFGAVLALLDFGITRGLYALKDLMEYIF